MNPLAKVMLLNEEFIFDGTLQEFNEKIKLNNNKLFLTEWQDYNKFKFLSKWSFGTFQTVGGPLTEGIKVYAEMEDGNEGKIKLKFTTKLRVEVYLITIFSGIIMTVAMLESEGFSPWVFLFLPFIVLWFWFVYHIQERSLVSVVKKYLVEKDKIT